MRQAISALLSGVLFGLGLALSEMVNPARVIGFLDISGDWDPTLALVMGGAVSVTWLLFPWVLRRERPRYAQRFQLPLVQSIDRSLIMGAGLFGLGWGITGLCPGPALAALVSVTPELGMFILAMAAGYWLAHRSSASGTG